MVNRASAQISVTVCTFRRPAGLQRLLQSLCELDSTTPSFEVVVVDNDAKASARSIIEAQRPTPFPLRYFVEPARGIAQARNRGVEEGSGEYIAFIDDDEWADPRWLCDMWRVIHEVVADGAFGPVVALLPEDTPAWIRAGRFFERNNPETGSALQWYDTSTSNTLIRRSALRAYGCVFDDKYALTGGEDSELFYRMLADGYRLVSSREGLVYESFPPARTKASWLLMRHFRNGMIRARLIGSKHAYRRLFNSGKDALMTVPRDRVGAFHHVLTCASVIGEVLVGAGIIYEPYRAGGWKMRRLK